MIRNEHEYNSAVARAEQQRTLVEEQRKALKAAGLKPREVARALEPLLSFHQQLVEEIEDYERLCRDGFDTKHELKNFRNLGTLLIRLRIAAGLSQSALAERLAVHVSQVSRDERNEYRGITLERAGRILDALGVGIEAVASFVQHSTAAPT